MATRTAISKQTKVLEDMERLSALLPEEVRQQIQIVMPNNDFEIKYRLDCRNLFAGFRESIPPNRQIFRDVMSMGLIAMFPSHPAKVIGGLLLYGGVNHYENLAKERLFKQQYVGYASRKLRLIVDQTSSNCSHQVQQELISTSQWLNISKTTLEDEIRQKDRSISNLEKILSDAVGFRKRADVLVQKLDVFKEKFL